MPGNFLNIDTELPTFTGKESEKDMVEAMMNYLTQLVEQLKYTLMNLDQHNFNQKALDDISTSAAATISEEVQTLSGQLNQVNSRVAALSVRMMTAEGEILGLNQDMGTLQTAVAVDSDGNITIGSSTVQVDLNGTAVNVNGDEVDLDTIGQDIGALQGDVSTLQGDVSTLQTDLGTAQGDITTLQTDIGTVQGDIVTVQGDISTLQTDLGTAQGDIGTLQTDMGTVQGDVGTLQGAVNVDQNGNITIGSSSVQVDINGSTVNINGTPQ